jgi:hypothetical protein
MLEGRLMLGLRRCEGVVEWVGDVRGKVLLS